MTQIIEFTKHLDNYLVYHYDFECNEQSAIGNFAGNCSLNKFMILNDWQKILDELSEPVKNYVENPFKQPKDIVQQIENTNFELKITWMEMEESFYSKLLQTIDFSLVFPFLMKVKVNMRSNVDKFTPKMLEKQLVRRKTSEQKKTLNERINQSILSNINGVADNSIKIRECCVRLPILRFDENGDVIQKDIVRNKRKHSSIDARSPNDSKLLVRAKGHTPKKSIEPNEFMCTNSSTPFVQNLGGNLKQVENDLRGMGKPKPKSKPMKLLTNRSTTTPRLSNNDHKIGSPFNPRIRLLTLPDNVNRLNTSNKQKRKNPAKKATTRIAKSTKRLKPKVKSIANESELFEDPVKTKKVKKTSAKAVKDISTHSVAVEDIVKVEERDLKSLTEDELWKSFDEHHDQISHLFLSYLKQTNATVQRAGDYNHFDMISLFTTDQFSIMLDILFDKFVKIGQFGEICYDAVFLELLIPEWALAIYMQRNSLDRTTAIRQISARKLDTNQSLEGYTTLLTIRLDETMNSTKN